ncbi:MAG: hypothetical protein U9R07_13550 [Pseudomonadota bacterium]|nr:hypothetical protein [Pseudomonadota bacterium]
MKLLQSLGKFEQTFFVTCAEDSEVRCFRLAPISRMSRARQHKCGES